MASLFYNASEVVLRERETILDALLRNGHDIPNGCRAGACQSCLMQVIKGQVPAAAQVGLKESQKKRGYFLSCSCVPTESLEVSLSDLESEKVAAVVAEKQWLNKSVVRVGVKADLEYFSGQYVTLWKDRQIPRSYSLASVPTEDQLLQFHIKRYPNGSFSRWAYDEMQVGDTLEVQGPFGDCFYVKADASQPIFMAAIGTGLAPLYGIVRDALTQGHKGPITMIIGSRYSSQFYLVKELMALTDRFNNFSIEFIAMESTHGIFNQGDIYQISRDRIPNLKGYKVFLCGAASFVKKMKKQCFMAGAAMTDIASDSFMAFG